MNGELCICLLQMSGDVDIQKGAFDVSCTQLQIAFKQAEEGRSALGRG